MNQPSIYVSATDFLCVYCWPASVPASHWDWSRLPCCSKCENKQSKQSAVPSFILRDIKAQCPIEARLDEAA